MYGLNKPNKRETSGSQYEKYIRNLKDRQSDDPLKRPDDPYEYAMREAVKEAKEEREEETKQLELELARMRFVRELEDSQQRGIGLGAGRKYRPY